MSPEERKRILLIERLGLLVRPIMRSVPALINSCQDLFVKYIEKRWK
jgi:hypothetical protein